jgi:hypothetical protein
MLLYLVFLSFFFWEALTTLVNLQNLEQGLLVLACLNSSTMVVEKLQHHKTCHCLVKHPNMTD